MTAHVSFRFPKETQPVAVVIEISLTEAWEILREQHRVFHRNVEQSCVEGQPGLTRSLMDKLRETMRSYPDPNVR